MVQTVIDVFPVKTSLYDKELRYFTVSIVLDTIYEVRKEGSSFKQEAIINTDNGYSGYSLVKYEDVINGVVNPVNLNPHYGKEVN